MNRGVTRLSSSIWGRSLSGPRAQLIPTLSKSKLAIEFQTASTVWADSVRPPSNTVNEAITGRRTLFSTK